MNSRLTTSFETEKKIIELQRLLKLSTKAAVMRSYRHFAESKA